MESLAVLVAIIFVIAVFAGPFAIGLTSKSLKRFLSSKAGIGWKVLDIIRKVLHIFAISIGTLVGFQLISLAVTGGKMIGVLAVVTCYIALRREYFPEVYIFGNLIGKLGIKRKNGRSSGNDGHGPEGQH
jgi:hypothetical protein